MHIRIEDDLTGNFHWELPMNVVATLERVPEETKDALLEGMGSHLKLVLANMALCCESEKPAAALLNLGATLTFMFDRLMEKSEGAEEPKKH